MVLVYKELRNYPYEPQRHLVENFFLKKFKEMTKNSPEAMGLINEIVFNFGDWEEGYECLCMFYEDELKEYFYSMAKNELHYMLDPDDPDYDSIIADIYGG